MLTLVPYEINSPSDAGEGERESDSYELDAVYEQGDEDDLGSNLEQADGSESVMSSPNNSLEKGHGSDRDARSSRSATNAQKMSMVKWNQPQRNCTIL